MEEPIEVTMSSIKQSLQAARIFRKVTDNVREAQQLKTAIKTIRSMVEAKNGRCCHVQPLDKYELDSIGIDYDSSIATLLALAKEYFNDVK